MKKYFILIAFVLCSSLLNKAFAQKKFTPAQKKAIDFLESKRAGFRASKNDSLFVVQNSDAGFIVKTMVRGDQAEDLEDQIYGSKPGEIVGPFDGETTFYLMKILKYDSLNRTKAKLISFYPKGEFTTDSAKFRKHLDKYQHTLS